MKLLIACALVLFSGCIPQQVTRQPELAHKDERNPVKVHFRGTKAEQDTLYICMFMYDEENMQCVDYAYFQEQYNRLHQEKSL